MINKNYSLLSNILLLSLVFICIFNIFHYDPIEGYDAEGHYEYVDHFSRYLPREINLPNFENSREFFNPPIGYLIPSFTQVLCRNIIDSETLIDDCRPIYSITTQIAQLLLYLFTLFIYYKTIKLFFNNKVNLKFEFLLLASLTAVNYKTIVQIRGEPYILFFLSCLLLVFLKAEKDNFTPTLLRIIQLGTIIGLLALSRQWAFLLFPAFFIIYFYVPITQKINYTKLVTSSFVLGFMISSWYYFSLFIRYGSFTAFNKDPIGFNLSNQPLNFYIPTLEDLNLVFTKPIRPNFSNQFLSILYSDYWGDYWGYFSFTSRKLELGRNQLYIGDYLARVNILSFFATIFILLSIFKILKHYKSSIFVKYIFFSVSISFFGYLWFLINYPALPTGDTNKAVYMAQFFNLLLISSTIFLIELKSKSLLIYKSLIIYFIFLYFHNYSSFLSHFPSRF